MLGRRNKPKTIAKRPVDEEVCNCTVLRKAARRVSMLVRVESGGIEWPQL